MMSFYYCVIPENIHTPPPPMDGQWKFLGGGGLKGRNFQGVQGVPMRIIFHRVVKDTIIRDILKYMWIILICSATKIRSRCPFEKKTSRCLSQTSSSLLGVRYHLCCNDLSTRSNDLL